MQSNFQEYVTKNKGNLITFKYNNETITKVVVDICGEYFTAKANETALKIDGFYYFSDCDQVQRNPIIDVLEKYKTVVIKTEKDDFMFTYIGLNESNLVHGKNLIKGTILSFNNLNSIKEILSIQGTKFEKVYPIKSVNERVTFGPCFIEEKKGCIKNLFCQIPTKKEEVKHFKFGEIPETTEEIPKEEKKSCVKNLFGSFETITTKESDDELRERLFGSMKNKFVNFNGVKMIVIDEHINMTGKFLEIKDLSNNEIKYVRKVDCEIL
jgi:hypothetical protein